MFVDMKDNFFGRAITHVPVGEPVLFKNDGNSPHNALAVDGSWSTEEAAGKLPIEPGDNVELVVDEPGVYEYFCTFHGTAEGDGMVATLVVGDVEFSPNEDVDQAAVPVWSGRTRRVPQDHETIQSAVNAARPGDLVLVGPGIYPEEVTVTTPSLTLRGTDRNDVVIDGEFERPNGVQVFADGVAVENMTARNHVLNGFIWSGVEGYRAAYLTAYNNADYGIFAFDSTDGVFQNSYASGSPDSGFYIGQCYPCRAVIDHVVAERNSLGYSGTNAGGELYIINSTWIGNRAGIVPNTLDSELLPPERETTIAGNLVLGNDNPKPPAKPGTYAAFGNGILIAGGSGNVIQDNVVKDHANHGILITPNLDEHLWFPLDNVVRRNQIRNSGRADLALAGPGSLGNCFEDNAYDRSAPFGLARVHGCDGLRLPMGFDLTTTMLTLAYAAQAPDGPVSLEEVAAQPPPRPRRQQLPGGGHAPVVPAVDEFDRYNREVSVDSVAVPLVPESEEGNPTLAANIYLGPNVWQLLFGMYAYLLPFVLYAAWTSLAFWDIARRDNITRRTATLWIAVILLVPFLGVIAYHVLGRSSLPTWLRATVVGGGLAVYAVLFVIGTLIGGII